MIVLAFLYTIFKNFQFRIVYTKDRKSFLLHPHCGRRGSETAPRGRAAAVHIHIILSQWLQTRPANMLGRYTHSEGQGLCRWNQGLSWDDSELIKGGVILGGPDLVGRAL